MFIVIEDMIQFFRSNIECFEYPELCTLNALRHQSDMRELFYYQWPGFHHTLLLVIFCGE